MYQFGIIYGKFTAITTLLTVFFPGNCQFGLEFSQLVDQINKSITLRPRVKRTSISVVPEGVMLLQYISINDSYYLFKEAGKQMFFKRLPLKLINIKNNCFLLRDRNISYMEKPLSCPRDASRPMGPSALVCLPMTVKSDSVSFLLSPQSCMFRNISCLMENLALKNYHEFCKPKH